MEDDDLEEDEKALRLKRRKLKDDFRTVMSSPGGRRFVWRLINAAGVFDAAWGGDALVTAHNEGKRSVGLILMREAQQMARASYLQMVAEAMAALPEETELDD